MEAFAQFVLQEGGEGRARLPDLLATLREFFAFVDRIGREGYRLHEDITSIHDRFEMIMHRFIRVDSDVDREMIEGIYESLFRYYGFLAGHKFVDERDFKDFRRRALSVKEELIGKLERYNAIRHDPGVDDEEREAIEQELSGGEFPGFPV